MTYSFGWEEFVKFSDPEQKKLEGTEECLFVHEWEIDFDVMTFYRYQRGLDLGLSPQGATNGAIRGTLSSFDVRSFDRFKTVAAHVREVLISYTPEVGEDSTFIVCAKYAEMGHFDKIPKKFQHHFSDA